MRRLYILILCLTFISCTSQPVSRLPSSDFPANAERSIIGMSTTTFEVLVQAQSGTTFRFERCHVDAEFFNLDMKAALVRLDEVRKGAHCERTDSFVVLDESTALRFNEIARRRATSHLQYTNSHSGPDQMLEILGTTAIVWGSCALVAEALVTFYANSGGGWRPNGKFGMAWAVAATAAITAAGFGIKEYVARNTKAKAYALENLWEGALKVGLQQQGYDPKKYDLAKLKFDPRMAMEALWAGINGAVWEIDKI